MSCTFSQLPRFPESHTHTQAQQHKNTKIRKTFSTTVRVKAVMTGSKERWLLAGQDSRNQLCIDLTKEEADVSMYADLMVSESDKHESNASRQIKRLQLSPRASFASSSSFGQCVSFSVGVSSSRRESDVCSEVSSIDSCSGRSNRSSCSNGSRASSDWDLFRSAHAGQYSRDEMSRAYQAYKQSAASVTPVTPVRVQASTAGSTFYKGGQYTPGGGRAPRGGAWY